ncbi:MAG: hypothetical protein HN356_05135 [Calditrichaeota bacterium]|jgi:hypothetical protein|nr:hypothetical protein [Calditrichota bacterium]
MTVFYNLKKHLLLPFLLIFVILLIAGCSGTGKYMIDDPVNDPIMLTDDQQDSDLVKVEEGGGGSAGGGCPT